MPGHLFKGSCLLTSADKGGSRKEQRGPKPLPSDDNVKTRTKVSGTKTDARANTVGSTGTAPESLEPVFLDLGHRLTFRAG